MNRHEAVTCLKEIHASCKDLSPDSISLVCSDPNDPFSSGYQLHIQTALDSEAKKQVQSIAKTHNATMKEEEGKVVIYGPKVLAQTT
jgi:hypothetical protein